MLVGGDAELDLVRSAVMSPPSLVVIAGEAGIGKSRLVRELVAADLRGVRVLLGHCQHLHEPLSARTGPGRAASSRRRNRRHRREPRGRCARAPDPRNRPSTAATTATVDRPEGVAASHIPGRRRTRHSPRPAVLVLEDLHWADSGTFDFLTYLAAHQPSGLTVIVTSRIETGSLPISEAFARAPAGPALSLRLAPLDVDEVGELVRHILAVDVPAKTAQALWETTGGIPFVVEESDLATIAGDDSHAGPMTRRLITVSVMCLAAASALAGCGDDGSAGPGSTTSAPSAAGTTDGGSDDVTAGPSSEPASSSGEGSATIDSATQAIGTAEADAGGTAYSIGDTDFNRSWEVEVAAGDRGVEVTVAVETGEVVGREEDDDLDDDVRAGLPQAEVAIADAIPTALAEVDGTLDGAELTEDDGALAWKVSIDTADREDDVDVYVDIVTGVVRNVDRD